MQLGGDPIPVRLNADLTRYHPHLDVGAEGKTVPGAKAGIWGSSDRFVAVRFDCCGAMLDVLWSSLDTIGAAAKEATH